MTAPAGEQQQENAGQGNDGGSGGGGAQGGITQEQMNKILATQKREIEAKFDGHDDYKSKAEQLDQLTESSRSELERATTSAAEFKSKFEGSESDKANLQTQLLRQKISATNHLDPDLWDRVTGGTAEEIEADVKKLVSKFGTAGGGSRSSKPLQSGASAPDGSTPKQRAAAALRGMNRN